MQHPPPAAVKTSLSIIIERKQLVSRQNSETTSKSQKIYDADACSSHTSLIAILDKHGIQC